MCDECSDIGASLHLELAWARGVTETQHPATVADAGSNPVGSTLLIEALVLWERKAGISSFNKGNLTDPERRAILILSQGAVSTHGLRGLESSRPFFLFRIASWFTLGCQAQSVEKF